jgi:predicted RNase H-like nuclease (RuvC/YqgF family)
MIRRYRPPPSTRDFYSVGIDPGVNGGICILSPEGKLVVAREMPSCTIQLW